MIAHRQLLTTLRAISFPTVTLASRSLAYVNNKRITRILANTEVNKSELCSNGNEAYIDVRLTNRNPRNLEQMLLNAKPMGYELDSPNRHFWNKLVFLFAILCVELLDD